MVATEICLPPEEDHLPVKPRRFPYRPPYRWLYKDLMIRTHCVGTVLHYVVVTEFLPQSLAQYNIRRTYIFFEDEYSGGHTKFGRSFLPLPIYEALENALEEINSHKGTAYKMTDMHYFMVSKSNVRF